MAHDLLDGTYQRLSVTGPEYGGGLSNHGPMAAEALLRLGREDAIEGWVTEYMRGLEDALLGQMGFRRTGIEWRVAWDMTAPGPATRATTRPTSRPTGRPMIRPVPKATPRPAAPNIP